jgi:hypothetical protein
LGFGGAEAAEHPLAVDELVHEEAGFGGSGAVVLVVLVDELFEVGELFGGEDEDANTPRWDSGVRKALKQAARAIRPDGAAKDHPGLDFPGFGPHSLRRANITWRQEVGGSSIETSKIAGHASTAITEEYTLVGLHRQAELTRLIQTKRARAERKNKAVASPLPVTPAQRERARVARTARKERKVVEIKKKEDAA